MFLSTERKSFLLIALCSFFLQACGSSQTNEKKDISLIGDTKSEFPFSTKEPEVYQGDFVASNGKDEDHIFVARNGDKWRYDTFHGAERGMSEIKSDKLYYIDHWKKTYWEMPEKKPLLGDVNDMTRNFFRGHEYHNFDEIGRDDSLIKYKVRETDPSKSTIVISIDAVSGMIVRQEFYSINGQAPDFVYEIRNLKLDVDDSIFQLPEGYRRGLSDEYRTSKNKNR